MHTHQTYKQLSNLGTSLALAIVLVLMFVSTEAKDYRKEHTQKGNLCIARFESTTGEPLYYNCPRPNDSEKKSYCCYLDKCCDYKEFQKQTEQTFKLAQGANTAGVVGKGVIGGVLKVVMWIIIMIIVLIVGCCCLTFMLCRKKKLFQGGLFDSPLPAQPPGPSPYAPPTNPYMAYQWPPDSGPAPPPAYPQPSYPPYPSARPAQGGPTQPPYNPNFK